MVMMPPSFGNDGGHLLNLGLLNDLLRIKVFHWQLQHMFVEYLIHFNKYKILNIQYFPWHIFFLWFFSWKFQDFWK